MLDEKDIEKLKKILATKEDMNNLYTALLYREEFEIAKNEIKNDINGLREMIQVLVVSVDKLVGAIDDLKQEYAMVAHQITRHEKWIKQIAEKVGIKLEY